MMSPLIHSHTLRFQKLLLACAIISSSFLGLCGCNADLETTTVNGTVAYRGKLLDHGSLRFFGATNRPLGAVIQPDGSYSISLPPGDYRVSVSSPPKMPANADPKDDTPPPPNRNALPARYSQVTKSDLKISLQLQEESQEWNLDLK